MKAFATGLLLLMTAVFFVTLAFEDEIGWLAYVRATAEAAMVGALADWFAVTALFRHPLGLPIPHTAIIPTRKDQIGQALGEFVQGEFLAADILVDRMRGAQIPARLGTWMADPANAARLASAAGDGLRAVLEVLDDDEVQAAIEQAVVARARKIAAAPLAGRALSVAIEGGHHQPLVESVLRAAGTFLDDNRTELRSRLAVESPWWVPEPIDDRIFQKVFVGAQRFLADVAEHPEHPLRRSFDDRLRDLARRLQTDPDLAARAEGLKDELLEHPSVRAWSASLWTELKAELVDASQDSSSTLRVRVEQGVMTFGERLQRDEALQAKVERWLEELVTYLAEHYRSQVAGLIAGTVERWDADVTSRKLELQVGRDLQFIRINGTVVGGLAGLLIYIVGRTLF